MSSDSQTTRPATVSASGRLCLFGEHSDWAASYGIHPGCCLVVGTDQTMKARVESHDRFVVESPIPDDLGRYNGRTRQMACDWNPHTLLTAAKDETEFFRYCAGVAHEMLRKHNLPKGLDIRITDMDLPLKKGVSSSAAVCILIAKAFDSFFDLKLFPHEIMDLAYLGERLTGSQCGRMDQACIYGKTPVLLHFEKGKEIKIEPIFPGNDFYLFFVDLGGDKDTVQILNDLQGNYLQSSNMQRALGEINEQYVRAACRHVQNGEVESLGQLMSEAQHTFDEYVAPNSDRQLKAPLLHKLLGFKDIKDNVYGGKGVGSQGDGTAQFLAKSGEDRDKALKTINETFPQMQTFSLTVSVTHD
jgi:galactokinase